MPRKTAATTSRIEKLRALAEHPNTPEHEAQLARHALARLLKQNATRPQVAAWMPAWHGEKWEETRRMPLTEVAARIRDEIKLLRKLGKQAAAGEGTLAIAEPIGDAPAGIRIGIRQLHYGSFQIWVKGVPEEWGWKRETHHGREVWAATDKLLALGRELAALANAYNYDNSDAYTDYYDRRFYLHVEAQEPGSTYAGRGIDHR